MSTSIAIPSTPADLRESRPAVAGPSSSSSSTYSSSPCTPQSAKSSSPSPNSAQKQKMASSRRPRLLSSAIQKEECTVINIGDAESPRLISYLTSSQGFTWNPEIFIPSYVDHEYIPLENRREPVHDIFLTDEEIREIYPDN